MFANCVNKFLSFQLATCLIVLISFGSPLTAAQTKLEYQVISESQHNDRSFTQGLYQKGDTLYESSGLYGHSFLSVYTAKNNTPLQTLPLPKAVFAEGLTLVDDILYVLTWREKALLRFQVDNLQPLSPIAYQEQGWGLTHNKSHFIMSDGSATLYFRNLKTFAIEKKIVIKNSWRKFNNLNELEYVDGYIYSNIWQSPYILKIDADSGAVVGIADFSELVKQNSKVKNHTVLNGIAYNAEQKAFWITGKLWNKRYLIRFEDPKKQPDPPPAETSH
ncbi:hypothetical protein TDB9533_04284 [Thalassocella blandensis]|nr:hypothetical protein TDB9533_04284 [Thalassocella blandensis]